MSDRINETVADLAATVDYLNDQVTEQADSFDFEELVALEDAAVAVKRSAEKALSMLRGAELKQLEASGTRQVGSRVFARVPNRVKRFDHAGIATGIRSAARQAAIDRETGEIDPVHAVELAVKFTQDVYVSPSTTAKVSSLDHLDIPRKSVTNWESRGYEIKVVDLDGDDDDDE